MRYGLPTLIAFILIGCAVLSAPAHAETVSQPLIDDDDSVRPVFTPIPRPEREDEDDGRRYIYRESLPWQADITVGRNFEGAYEFIYGGGLEFIRNNDRWRTGFGFEYVRGDIDITFDDQARVDHYRLNFDQEIGLGFEGIFPFWLEPIINVGAAFNRFRVDADIAGDLSLRNGADVWEFDVGGGARFRFASVGSFMAIASYNVLNGDDLQESIPRTNVRAEADIAISETVSMFFAYRWTIMSDEDRAALNFQTFITEPQSLLPQYDLPFLLETDAFRLGVRLRFGE